jgi:hypothetical protein
MIRGSCLCGGVTFEIERAVGPFELCHCSRCRKNGFNGMDRSLSHNGLKMGQNGYTITV